MPGDSWAELLRWKSALAALFLAERLLSKAALLCKNRSGHDLAATGSSIAGTGSASAAFERYSTRIRLSLRILRSSALWLLQHPKAYSYAHAGRGQRFPWILVGDYLSTAKGIHAPVPNEAW